MQKRTFLWRADWVRRLDKKEARDLWQVMGGRVNATSFSLSGFV